MRSAARLRLAFALLAWLAQAFMPVAHAALMAGDPAAHGAWCGDPAGAQAARALLPASLRAALDDGTAHADTMPDCTLLCASGSTAPPPVDIPPGEALRAAGLEPAPAAPCCPRGRPQSPTPPSHAPPANA